MAVKRSGGALAALLAAGGLWAWQNRDKIQGWVNDPNTRSKVQGWLGGLSGSSSSSSPSNSGSTSSTSGSASRPLSDYTYNGNPSSSNQFDPNPLAGNSSSGQFDPSPATGPTRRIGTDINNPAQTPDDPFKAGI